MHSSIPEAKNRTSARAEEAKRLIREGRALAFDNANDFLRGFEIITATAASDALRVYSRTELAETLFSIYAEFLIMRGLKQIAHEEPNRCLYHSERRSYARAISRLNHLNIARSYKAERLGEVQRCAEVADNLGKIGLRATSKSEVNCFFLVVRDELPYFFPHVLDAYFMALRKDRWGI